MQPSSIQAYVLSSCYFKPVLHSSTRKKRRTGGQQCHLLVRMSSEVEEGEAG